MTNSATARPMYGACTDQAWAVWYDASSAGLSAASSLADFTTSDRISTEPK